jgi:hypothetical protein
MRMIICWEADSETRDENGRAEKSLPALKTARTGAKNTTKEHALALELIDR